MKKVLFLLLLFPILVRAQTVNVRIYDGIDSFRNDFWNNWHPVHKPDTSAAFSDIFGNSMKIRAVLQYFEQIYDNGATYSVLGKSTYPDTVVRKGVYNSGLVKLTLTGLDDSSIYAVTLFASRNRTDTQRTRYSIPGIPVDTGTIQATMNATKTVTFSGLQSAKGVITVQLQNLDTYNYLNAFTLIGSPKHPALKAAIWIDSTSIHYPRSYVKLSGSSSVNAISHYQWFQTAGAPAIFNNFGDTIWISGLTPGSYRFELMVQDSIGDLDSAFANVTVNGPTPCPICQVCPSCPTCPVCPPPVVCPVCPAPRQATGIQWTYSNGTWNLVITYSDGSTQTLPQ